MQNISKLTNNIGKYHPKYSANHFFAANLRYQYSLFSKNKEMEQERMLKYSDKCFTNIKKQRSLHFHPQNAFSNVKSNP